MNTNDDDNIDSIRCVLHIPPRAMGVGELYGVQVYQLRKLH